MFQQPCTDSRRVQVPIPYSPGWHRDISVLRKKRPHFWRKVRPCDDTCRRCETGQKARRTPRRYERPIVSKNTGFVPPLPFVPSARGGSLSKRFDIAPNTWNDSVPIRFSNV